jgi:hypothetical protein
MKMVLQWECRIKVLIDVQKPLIRGVTMDGGGAG